MLPTVHRSQSLGTVVRGLKGRRTRVTTLPFASGGEDDDDANQTSSFSYLGMEVKKKRTLLLTSWSLRWSSQPQLKEKDLARWGPEPWIAAHLEASGDFPIPEGIFSHSSRLLALCFYSAMLWGSFGGRSHPGGGQTLTLSPSAPLRRAHRTPPRKRSSVS